MMMMMKVMMIKCWWWWCFCHLCSFHLQSVTLFCMIGTPHTVLFVIIISFIITFALYSTTDPCANTRELVRPVHKGGSHIEDSQRMGMVARPCIWSLSSLIKYGGDHHCVTGDHHWLCWWFEFKANYSRQTGVVWWRGPRAEGRSVSKIWLVIWVSRIW